MKSVFVYLIAFGVFACAERAPESNQNLSDSSQNPEKEITFKDVSVDSAYSMIQRNIDNPNFVVLDVRTPGEFDSGHIENAILIDFRAEDFRQNLGDLDKSKTYLVHCRSGNRSGQALKIMQEFGFQSVYHINKGLRDWQEKGLPVVKE